MISSIFAASVRHCIVKRTVPIVAKSIRSSLIASSVSLRSFSRASQQLHAKATVAEAAATAAAQQQQQQQPQHPPSLNIQSKDQCAKTLRDQLGNVKYLSDLQRYPEVEMEIEKSVQLLFDRSVLQHLDAKLLQEYIQTLSTKIEEARREGYIFPNFPPFRVFWGVSVVMQEIGMMETALEYLQLALVQCEEQRPDEKDAIIMMKIGLGQLHRKLKQWEESYRAHRAALDVIGTRINLNNGHSIGTAHWEIGQYHLHMAKTQGEKLGRAGVEEQRKQAIKSFERAFSIFESYYGWSDPTTVEIARKLAELYLENDRLDIGIIVSEKALIGLEVHQAINASETDPRKVTKLGMYLAKAYEKKKYLELQQATLTRTMNILKRREQQYDQQLYKECIYKLQNMLGACRFLLGDHLMALSVFQKMAKSLYEIYPMWSKQDPQEANLEVAYMYYFMGATQVAIKRFDDGIMSLKNAKDYFEQSGVKAWISACDANIKEAQELAEKEKAEKKSQQT